MHRDEPFYLSMYWEPGFNRWLHSALVSWERLGNVVLEEMLQVDAKRSSLDGYPLTELSGSGRVADIMHHASSARSGTLLVKSRQRQRDVHFIAHFEGDEAPISHGHPAPAYCVWSWCLNCLSELQLTRLATNVIPYFVDACQNWNCQYALIEAGRASDTRWGRVHCLSDSTATNFSRRVLVTILNRRRVGDLCARGVFWANWFGAAMCARLGGAAQLVDQFGQWDDGKDHDLGSVFGESALLRLTRDVRALLPPFVEIVPTTLERAAWLHHRLTHANLLPGSFWPQWTGSAIPRAAGDGKQRADHSSDGPCVP